MAFPDVTGYQMPKARSQAQVCDTRVHHVLTVLQSTLVDRALGFQMQGQAEHVFSLTSFPLEPLFHCMSKQYCMEGDSLLAEP